MASGEKITVWFEPKGDKQLVKAINALAKSQGRLSQAGDNVTRTNQRVSKSTKNSNASMLALGGTMSVVRSKLLVYSFATTLVTKTIGAFTSAAMKQEDAEKKLAVQLGFTSKRLLEYATAQQKVTAFGDEEVLSVMGQISAFAKSEEQIEALTKATLDLSEGMGIGLNEAGLLIGKTFGSTTNSLSRYGIAVSGTAGSQARLESLTASVAGKYGDLSKKIDTTSKAIKQMKNAIGDAAEEVGFALLPSLKESAIKMTDFVHNSLIPFIKNVKKIDWEKTAENIKKGGDEIVRFFVGLLPIWFKVATLLGESFVRGVADGIFVIYEFFSNLSGNLAQLMANNFFAIGLEAAKGLMKGFNWLVDKMPKVADMLGIEKFNFDNINTAIVENQKAIGDNPLFKFFKEGMEGDITDINSLLSALTTNFEDTIGQLIAYQQEVIDNSDGGGGDGGGGFFAKLFNMSDDEKAAFQEQHQMFHDAIMGVANAYDKLKMQQITQAKQAELDSVQGIRNERIRTKKLEEIEAKYAEKTRKHKEKMKKVKVAEAISNTALAITAAWDEPPPLNFMLAALIAASGALQIQTIKAQKYQYGGLVGGRRHSQGGTMIEAEQGEFVMSRDATEAIGIENLNRMNTGLGGGGGSTIVINNPILGKDMIEDEIVPQIQEALRRGGDIGV
tara:strand:- start:13055 stop:15073 length:2019 start_codon:yes stop_codon:yes gene_type:complete